MFVSSFDSVVKKFRSYAPEIKANFILFLTLISYSLSLYLSSLIFLLAFWYFVKLEYIKEHEK